MKKTLLALSLLTALLAGGPLLHPPTAAADDPPAKWGRGDCRGEAGERFLDRMSEKLGLSADQQQQIRSIIEEHRNKVAPLRQSLADSREKLRQAAAATPFDEAAVRALAESQSAARTELTVERARMRSRIDAVLTPEQREMAEKMRPEMGHRGERPHHGGW